MGNTAWSSYSKGKVSGYVCNHSFLRSGTRHCVPLPYFRNSCTSSSDKKWMTFLTNALLCSRPHQLLHHRLLPANVKFISPVPSGTLNPCGLPMSPHFCDECRFDCWVEAPFWVLKWRMGHRTVSWTKWTRHCQSIRPQVHIKCSIWDICLYSV